MEKMLSRLFGDDLKKVVVMFQWYSSGKMSTNDHVLLCLTTLISHEV